MVNDHRYPQDSHRLIRLVGRLAPRHLLGQLVSLFPQQSAAQEQSPPHEMGTAVSYLIGTPAMMMMMMMMATGQPSGCAGRAFL